MATDRSTEGMPVYPKAAPPSRVVRGEEPQDLFRAVKGAFHDLVSSSCTSGKNGTGGGRWKPARPPPPPPRNHSSNLEGSGRGGGFHTSPAFSAARESIAVISGSGSDNATTPEGGNTAESSSPEREGSPSDAARGVAPVGDVGVLTPTLFTMRGFNTHTFSAVFPQFCTNALQQSLLGFLWPLCVWECARCSCLLSPPSQTWHRLWVWPADDWLFCLKSRLSWCVRFIGQLVLRRRELMVIYISLFQVLLNECLCFRGF